MNMVGHHHPSEDIHLILLAIIFQPPGISFMVFIGYKAILTVVTTLDNVKRFLEVEAFYVAFGIGNEIMAYELH